MVDAQLTPTLDAAELAALEPLGTRRSVEVGEYLYREGDTTYDFYVVLSGVVEIIIRDEAFRRIIATQPQLSDRILAAFMARRTYLP
jgi:thioredoxin reductase (NADPH)